VQAEPSDLAVPLGIERIVLTAGENTIAVGVISIREVVHGLLHRRIDAAEKGVVALHLVRQVRAEDATRLAVDGVIPIGFAAHRDAA
jgi:hypothetical protein